MPMSAQSRRRLPRKPNTPLATPLTAAPHSASSAASGPRLPPGAGRAGPPSLPCAGRTGRAPQAARRRPRAAQRAAFAPGLPPGQGRADTPLPRHAQILKRADTLLPQLQPHVDLCTTMRLHWLCRGAARCRERQGAVTATGNRRTPAGMPSVYVSVVWQCILLPSARVHWDVTGEQGHATRLRQCSSPSR